MKHKEECAEVFCPNEVVNGQQSEKVITRNAEFTFEIRESLLTTRFRSLTDIRALYNWILGIIFIHFLSNCINYVFNSQDLETDVNLLKYGFRNFGVVILLEIFYALWSISQWILATSRARVNYFPLFSIQFVLIAIYIVVPIAVRLNYDMSFAIGMITTVEQIRISMKVYSFWIESAKIDRNNPATFSQFIYFWFAPTLLFRQSYPRTKRRSYKKCVVYILECLACIFVTAIFVRNNLINGIWDPKNHPIRIKNIPMIVFETFLTTTCLAFLIWYLLFHCWFNAWAEALKFGDRHFYGPWWLNDFNKNIHRVWNPLVHRWLKTYVYLPIYEKMGRKIAFLTTMIISSIAHEYATSFACGFFVLWSTFFLLGACIPIFCEPKAIRTINSVVNSNTMNSRAVQNTNNVLAFLVFSFFYTFIGLYIAFESYFRASCSTTQRTYRIMDFIVPKLFDCIEFA